MTKILITNTNGQLRSEKLNKGVYSIGKHLLADFTLADKSIGRKKLKLTVNTDHCAIETANTDDRFSFNGVDTHSARILDDDDVIVFGETRIQLVSGKQRAPAASEVVNTPIFEYNSHESEDENHQDELECSSAATMQSAPQYNLNDDGYIQRYEYRRQILEQLQKKLELYTRDDVVPVDELRAIATQFATEIVRSRSVIVPETINENLLIEEVVSELIGYGPLEPLLNDKNVSEIMVNGFDKVYVERDGVNEKTSIKFIDEPSLMAVIERIVNSQGRRIDEGSPMVDVRLAEYGARVNATIRPISVSAPTLTIRKFRDDMMTLNHLVSGGSLSREMADFLRLCVEQRKSIIVSGATASGKTTFLNALSNSIPENERIITIEDTAELNFQHQHLVRLEARRANSEGKGEVSIRELLQNTLRMKPDRIVIGECRDGTAHDMLQAMSTGHDGSMTTTHADSPRQLFTRLELLRAESDINMSSKNVQTLISTAVNVIVQQKKFADGSRRIIDITEVVGIEGDVILLNDLFKYDIEGFDDSGNVIGTFKQVGLPQLYAELEADGVPVDPGLFEPTTMETGL